MRTGQARTGGRRTTSSWKATGSPDRNPDLWSVSLMTRLARLAAPDATFATWSSARRVRDALAAAGFEPRRVRGYAGKREMTVGRFRADADR